MERFEHNVGVKSEAVGAKIEADYQIPIYLQFIQGGIDPAA